MDLEFSVQGNTHFDIQNLTKYPYAVGSQNSKGKNHKATHLMAKITTRTATTTSIPTNTAMETRVITRV